MIKFLLGVAIVAFTTFCAYVLSKKYRKRKTYFTQWTTFNERFLNEITYCKRPLQSFFNGYVYKDEFGETLENFSNCMKNRLPLRDNLLSGEAFYFIKKDEKTLIEDYFSQLGKGDSVSQKTYFQSMSAELQKRQTEATETAKKYGDLYIKLGFLCGLLILILVI